MRHGKYGLTNAVELTDDQIETQLSPEALKELKDGMKENKPPVTYLIQKVVGNLDDEVEFTVSDMYIMLHKADNPDAPSKQLKLHTIRTTLSNLARREDTEIEVSKKSSKVRLYKKVSMENGSKK